MIKGDIDKFINIYVCLIIIFIKYICIFLYKFNNLDLVFLYLFGRY